MKLLVINQYGPPDGAATAQMLGDLVERAAQDGAEVTVICSDRSYADPAVRYPRQEQWKGVDVRRVAITGFGRSGTLGRAVDYVTFLIRAAIAGMRAPKPDVTLGLSTPPILGALAVVLARLRGGRAGYWAMDVYPDVAFALGALEKTALAGCVLGAISRWTLRSADVAIALGECMAERLTAGGARRVATVHNWADERSITPTPTSESRLRRARGWGRKFVVLYSGNLGLAHTFDAVLDAAAQLSDANVVFAFAGTGPRLDEVKTGAARRSLSNVEFLSAVPREDLGDLLAAGDLHLITLREGMPGLLVPSKVYGILAAGRPILYVGPAEGEIHGIVNRGCGTALRTEDADGVARAVRSYADDEARRSMEGHAARALFDTAFTRASQTATLLEALSA